MKINSTSINKAFLVFTVLSFFTMLGCEKNERTDTDRSTTSILNLDHLDHLGEVVTLDNEELRLIHIYAEAPDYNWVGDSDEGISCVDDVARAAVVYLRHFELTGDEESALKAKQLLRFILYMQTDDGLFHNFVFSNELDKNTTHQNSVADEINWWAARGIWALGEGARTLMEYDSSFAQVCLTAVDKSIPRINETLASYPETRTISNYKMPAWLIGSSGSDASSELLLGLAAAQKTSPKPEYEQAINKIAEGISMMQYGDLSTAPYGAHLSWEGGWHGWGNSQTMALVEAGFTESSIHEGTHFYPWLLVNGWLHSFPLNNPSDKRYYEQIAYATRAVSVGLVNLYEETGNEDFGIMAGLAASWFTGNNVVGEKMYDSAQGYGYDGINDENTINKNSGAESTIEALMTIMEVEQHPVANKWMFAKTIDSGSVVQDQTNYKYKIFETAEFEESDKIMLLLNLDNSSFKILNEEEYHQFLNN